MTASGRCDDCGTRHGELHADYTGNVLCGACYGQRSSQPDTKYEPPTKDRYVGRRIDLAGIDADENVPWRCDRLVADGYVSVIAGKGGDGKTWLALGLAAGVHRGATVAGIECRKGHAIILDAESGPKLLKRRLRDSGVPSEHSPTTTPTASVSERQTTWRGWSKESARRKRTS